MYIEYRGPSYHRRQERRKAAKSAAAPAAPSKNITDAEQVDKSDQAEEAHLISTVVSVQDQVETQEAEEAIKDSEMQKSVELAEKVSDNFECPLCDFTSKWQNGLNVHLARKHSKIDQLDGSSEIEDSDADDKYEDTKHYWKNGWLGSVYQVFISANDLVDDSDMPEDVKALEKENILEARKAAFGDNFRYYPPWGTDD